ncbi:DUF4143 domain-containing protein [Amycolatopsis alkalitolerans]|uniref:DUF4143 domain-containing protein n=1 Tax=Amycolatopsis alkalitolerans TaxID=2547244 RepID=UPI003898DF64
MPRPAWWTNRIKRLVRGPKRYVIDPSLALAALRIGVPGLMKDGDLPGRIIDTFVVAQLRAQLASCETQPRLHPPRLATHRTRRPLHRRSGAAHRSRCLPA